MIIPSICNRSESQSSPIFACQIEGKVLRAQFEIGPFVNLILSGGYDTAAILLQLSP